MSLVFSALDQIDVRSPCPVEWDCMSGDDHVRFCNHCRQNVFNLSVMTQEEAMDLIRQKEGQACVRFFRRTDGTVLTRDCSEFRMVKFQRRVRTGVGALLAFLIVFLTWADGRSHEDSRQVGLLKRLYDRLFPPAPAAPPAGAFVTGAICLPKPSDLSSQGNDESPD
jgi:hypothetical protein